MAAVKKARLRVIDQGTRYDTLGGLVQLSRDANAGRLGRVTDAVIIVRSFKDGHEAISMRHVGTGKHHDVKRLIDYAHDWNISK